MSVLLAFTAAALATVGTYLILQRILTRIIIGLGLLGHAANIVLLTSGRRGRPPLNRRSAFRGHHSQQQQRDDQPANSQRENERETQTGTSGCRTGHNHPPLNTR